MIVLSAEVHLAQQLVSGTAAEILRAWDVRAAGKAPREDGCLRIHPDPFSAAATAELERGNRCTIAFAPCGEGMDR